MSETQITLKARIDKIIPEKDETKAFASLIIGDAFAIHDIRITDKDNKISIRMPYRTYKQGAEVKYVDEFHAITANARAYMIATISQAYEQALEQEMEERVPKKAIGMSQQM